jgi:3-hydroxyisobutyrate dehydrogenase
MRGGRIGAENGKLILLIGGNAEKLTKLKKDLKAISEKFYYFGKAGSGIRFKLILNMVQAIHIGALGEAITLAKTIGLDLKKTGDALTERPGGTTTKLAWRDYQVEPKPINFSVDWITKDLKYVKKSAKKIKTPLLNEMLKKYKSKVKMGMGHKDWTEVNKV